VVARKRAEVELLRARAEDLWAKASSMVASRGFRAALRDGSVIAEMKRRSPSGGTLQPDLDPPTAAEDYAQAGAAAISVLTDGPDFGGSLDDLAAVRARVAQPVLRKDFTVDALQIAQARAAGADAVLLIVSILGDLGLKQCLAAAAGAGLDALVEVHDEHEAALALDHGATLVGINNRDLRSLSTDLGTFSRLRPLLPENITVVAESGVRTAADCARMIEQGATAVLVGEALMRAPDPHSLCAAMVEAARHAAGSGRR
jgi:indole-3-glycerol phosphate synthase